MNRPWNPTPQQREATTAAGKSLLVSAAAGSGKTSVLAKTVAQLYSSEELTGAKGYTQEAVLGFPGGRDKCQRHCSR